ncbi:hypothetical protein CBR_g48414 [Chara braunii]|uniref:HAT C-terminal dimerisation domain-containing protein n=1 Tax=Chara braunii TaxID=69332 RepID=A0A388M2U1_CHABU|nr:hypothetical protein CBR_g48414 [Chara braunii]|eukprot:GBG88799.1 hypothetical protein CBR_g48414 [Chara braunii]
MSPRFTLVEPVDTRFASVFLMLTCLKGRRDSLESTLHGDAWARIPWERRLVSQAQWVQQQIRDSEFWRCVDCAFRVMLPIHQLLRRMDRGGMMMSIVYEWSQHLLELMRKVDVPAEIVEPCVREVAVPNLHMLELAHAAAHLLNPRRLSFRYYESLQTTTDDARVVEECDRFLLAQTGDDPVGRLYRTLSDAEADDCRGDRETERCAQWWFDHGRHHRELRTIAIRVMHLWTSASPTKRNWVQHECINTARRHKLGFAKLAQLVEIATNLKLDGCAQQGSGYVLPWVMGTGQEETAEGQKDDEGDVDPEVWGARSAGSFSEQDIERQVVAFHACRPSRADPVEDVFGKRAVELRPWPEQTSDADVDGDTSDDEWTDDDDAPVSGDATTERVYFTYGGGPDGMTPHTSVITDDVPSGGQASDTGRAGGRRRRRPRADEHVEEQEPLRGLRRRGFWSRVDAGAARQGVPMGVEGDGVPTGVEGDGGDEDEDEDEEGSDHGDDHGDDGGDHGDGGNDGDDGNHDDDHGDDGGDDDEGRLALVLRDPSVPSLPLTRPEAFAQAGFDVDDLARLGSHDPFPPTGRRSGERCPPGGAYSPPPYIVDSPRWSGSSLSGIRGRESGPVDGGSGRRSDSGGSAGSMPPPSARSTEGGADGTTARAPIAGSSPPVAGGVVGGWAAHRRVSDRMRVDYDVGRGAFTGRLSPRFQVVCSSEGGFGRPSLHMAGRMLGLSRSATRRVLMPPPIPARGTTTDMQQG